MTERSVVLDVRRLSVSFSQYKGGLTKSSLPVLYDMNLTVRAGEVVAVVGSSGSGKSLLAHAILGVLPYNGALDGEMHYKGQALTPRRQAELRGKEIVLVPQSVSYLDPLLKVGAQIRGGDNSPAAKEKTALLLSRYGLEQSVQELYPFELSGGMARRVLIATALMHSPGLVIADEPTPGLHISVARRVMGHFREIADDGAGVLVITHDLELALLSADRVVVFYGGTAVEEAPAQDFASESTLRHPYTKALWRAMPANGFQSAPGTQPYGGGLSGCCPFETRCPSRKPQCKGEILYRPLRGGHVRCVLGEAPL